MQVNVYAEAGTFLVGAASLLASDPFSTNVIADVAGRFAGGASSEPAGCLWATVEGGDGRVVGVAMQTPPHNLFVSLMPPEAAAALAGSLVDSDRELRGVNGEVTATGAFAQAWEARTGRRSRVVTAMRMYRLGELARPGGVPGHAALAGGPTDVDLVAGWAEAFHDEAQPQAPVEDWGAWAARRVSAGEVHLWQTPAGAVAMAAASQPAAGVARVGPVYTPPGQRRRGYGAAVTAAAAGAALDAGAEHVVLYTNLANPTSNSIYQAIGFQAHHDAEERALE